MNREVFLAAVSIALIGHVSAADKRKTCSGEFTDMPTIGVTVSDCDLNDISNADLQYVRQRCGKPFSPKESGNRTPKTCAITVIAGPRRPNRHGALVFPVRRVVRE